MKRLLGFLISFFMLLSSCQEDAQQQLDAQKIAQKNEAVFKNISKMWQFQFPEARPEIQTTLAAWNAWRQFEIELLQKQIAAQHGYEIDDHSLVLYVRPKTS